MLKRAALLFILCLPAFSQNPNTATFPSQLLTDEVSTVAKDRSVSVLDASIDADDLTLTVDAGHGSRFVQFEIITIEDEQMMVCSVAGDTLTICPGTRGFSWTTAVSHSNGADVSGNYVEWIVNQLNAEMKAVQTLLGINGTGVLRTNVDSTTAAETTTTFQPGVVKPGLRVGCGPLPSTPGTGGVLHCNSTDANEPYWYDGTIWKSISESVTGIANRGFERTGTNFSIDQTAHGFDHGNLIVTIYDFDTENEIDAAVHVDRTAPYAISLVGNLSSSRHMWITIAGWGGPSGAVSFTQSGTGAVSRTVQEKVQETISVTDFGAVDNGSTNNKTAIKNAIAEAIARKATLRFPATSAGGVYKTSSGFIINSTLNITCDPGVVIDTTGTDDTAHHGFSFTPTFTAHDITGTPALGAVALTVADAALFAVGDEVQVQIGAEPFDYTISNVSYFAKIVAISGTTVTVDVPVPEAAPSTLSPGTSPASRIIKFTTSTNHSSIRGCSFRVTDSIAEDGSGTSPNFDQWISIERTKDLTLDVRGIRVAGSILANYAENLRIENLVVDRAVRRNVYGGSGSVLSGWGCRNCSAGNVTLKHVGYDGVHLEGQTRGFHFDHLWIERSPLDQGSGLVVLSGSRGVTVDTYHYYGPGAGASLGVNAWTMGDKSSLRIRNAYLYNQSNNTELNLDVGLETLGIDGIVYRNKQKVRLVYPLLVSSGGADLGLPDGTYTRFDTYFSSTTGASNMNWGACASVGFDNTNPPIIQPAVWQRLPHLNLWGNQHPFSRCPEGKRTFWFTDGTVPANSYVIFEIEYFPITNEVRNPVFHNDPPTSGITRASPTQVRYEQHGLTTGDTVVLTGAPGDCTAMNGSYAVTVTDHENYTIPYNSTSGCTTDVTYAEASVITISRSTGDGGPTSLRPGDIIYTATDKRAWDGAAWNSMGSGGSVLANNTFFKGTTTGAVEQNLIGTNTSNEVAIDPSGSSTRFGGNVYFTNFPRILTNAVYYRGTQTDGGQQELIGTDGSNKIAIDPNAVGARFGGALSVAGTVIHTASATPATASDTCTTGQQTWDATHFYLCIATNTWRRIAHATW